ncbi:fluoride efflux transporter CrcB [Undibacterium sp. Jales W-56]|uniref:fluoride efflux transporter CrcB n=1 Tax=Undibacterium sp. Jales W-56 TaxID=2897325 RepID=UPI0021D27C3A|nr:fluoride efflux transporter CrcB [Undibacterium sp. Jales W-56]MCU6433126.1 fluoride efflux transporter CrcB [Undibacterium sp. Jales W-56]
MNGWGFLAVGAGAALGAWLRWALGVSLNTVFLHVPVGTLIANLGGGYLIGICVAFFSAHPHVSQEWRLLLVTGFLGGLTTFSTFSAEAMSLLQRGDYGWAVAHSGLHLIGSIIFCFAGFATWRALSAA